MLRTAVLLGLALAAGCADDPAGEIRPTSKRASFVAEGRTEQSLLSLYNSPPGFPLPFSTYVPQGMRVETAAAGAGYVVSFTPHPGGERDGSRFMHLFVHPDTVRFDDAREVARTVAERVRVPGARAEAAPAREHPWAAEELAVRSEGSPDEPVSGWVALGSENGRWFHFAVQHGADDGGSFSRNVERILEEWRWTDTGLGLGPVSP